VEECSLPQIPARLHASGRPALPIFEVGELLYRRCKPEEVENPYAAISLTDLSVNRTGPAEIAPLCEAQDVLRNFSDSDSQEWIADQVAVTMAIKEVNQVGTYRYEATQPDGEITDTCILELAHAQEPCNYSHSAFKLFLNGEEVTFANYKSTLGEKKRRKFRDQCRFELSKMILKGEIWLPPDLSQNNSQVPTEEAPHP
jgi:hypothetical protein